MREYLPSECKMERHSAGLVALGVTYGAAGLSFATGTPAGIAVGGAILAVPDVVIYAAGYALGSDSHLKHRCVESPVTPFSAPTMRYQHAASLFTKYNPLDEFVNGRN